MRTVRVSLFLSFFLALGITHHAIVERVQVTKASCKRSQRDGARRLGSFFFLLFVHALTAFALLRRLPISFCFERVSVCLLTPGAYMDGERRVESGEREREEEMKGRSRRYEVVLMRWACSESLCEREKLALQLFIR